MRYEECLVSYIDVLGFRNLIDTREVREILDVISLLKNVTDPPQFDNEEEQELMYAEGLINPTYCQSISDAVVRVAAFARKVGPEFGRRPNTDALFFEVDDLLGAQISLAERGILIRGGMSIGKVYIDPGGNGPIFGPGLVRAYELESREAVFPRLVVDDKLLEEFKNNPKLTQYGADDDAAKELYSLLRTGDDGMVFLDYVQAAHMYCGDFVGYLRFLEGHAQLIKAKLENSKDGRVRRKLIWLKRYHNDVVRKWIEEFDTNNEFSEKFKCSVTDNVKIRLKSVIV